MTAGGDLDPAAVVAEVEDDVRRRRAAGEFPPGLEQELDAVLARFALDDAGGAAFDRQLTRVERAAVLDLAPSLASARPGAAQAKKLVHKAIGFEVRHVAGQVGELGAATAEALRALDRRMEALEGGALAELLPSRPPLDLSAWFEVITGRLRGAGAARGRVAHAGAGDTSLVDALAAAGVDAYLVEGPVEAHLGSLAPGSLGGVVFSDWVDDAPAVARWRAVQLAAAALVPGAGIAVVTSDAAAWEAGLSPIAADLAPGRPYRPETWAHVLERAGFETSEVHAGAASHAVTAVRPG